MKSDFTMEARALPALRDFVAVVDHGGFAAAARALGLSTSALSQAVRGLEARLGMPLLVRTTRSVNLTDAGRLLYDQAAPGLHEVLAALQAVREVSAAPVGTLRLNVPTTAMGPVVEPLLRILSVTAPRLQIELVSDNRLVDIVEEGADAGFRLDEALRQDMVAVRASPPFRWALVASPEYLQRHGIPTHPDELRSHRGVAFRYPTSGRLYEWEFEKGPIELRAHAPGSVVVDHPVALLHAARAGMGLAYLDQPYVVDDLASGRLVEVLQDWMPTGPGWFVYFPLRSQRLPKIRALADAARQHAARPL